MLKEDGQDNLKVWMRFFGILPWKFVFFFSLVYNKNTHEVKFVSLFTITHQITNVIWNIQGVKLLAWVSWEHFVVETVNCQKDFLLHDSITWNFKPCLTLLDRPIRNCSLNCISFSPITEALWLLRLYFWHSFFL